MSPTGLGFTSVASKLIGSPGPISFIFKSLMANSSGGLSGFKVLISSLVSWQTNCPTTTEIFLVCDRIFFVNSRRSCRGGMFNSIPFTYTVSIFTVGRNRFRIPV